MKNITRIFITGGTGYIGENLALALSKEDRFKVGLIKRQKSNYSRQICSSKNISKYSFDEKISSLVKVLKNFSPDIVIHLAANVQTTHTKENLKDIIDGNILFSSNLLEAMKICNIKRFINTGTYWQYQKDIYSPIALYAATKQAFEKILEFYVLNHNLISTTLILYDIYGPNDKRKKIVNYLYENKEKKITISLNGGSQYFYPVHISDIIKAFKIASLNIIKLKKPIHNKYTLKPLEYFKLKKFLSIFSKEFKSKFKIKWNNNFSLKPYLKDLNIPFKNLPGWHQRVKISKGLKTLNSVD